MNLDLALRVDAPPKPTDATPAKDGSHHELWEESSRTRLMTMKSTFTRPLVEVYLILINLRILLVGFSL